jgi:hypothetical protein
MSLWGANSPDEELAAMSRLVDSVLSDSEAIIFDSTRDYFYLTDDIDAEKQAAAESESLAVYKWTEL